MSALDACSTPRFLPGVRLHYDQTRDQWVILAPERVIELDDIAHAIVQRCNGERSIAMLIAFIFPCTFIVLFFPIVMKFMNSGL